MVPVRERDQFAAAIRTKIIRERRLSRTAGPKAACCIYRLQTASR
jgi:hypothetical protein